MGVVAVSVMVFVVDIVLVGVANMACGFVYCVSGTSRISGVRMSCTRFKQFHCSDCGTIPVGHVADAEKCRNAWLTGLTRSPGYRNFQSLCLFQVIPSPPTDGRPPSIIGGINNTLVG